VNAYSEGQIVKQPAIRIIAALGWQTVPALEEVFGIGGTLGRETKGESVLVPRLRAALERPNPSLPPEAISGAMDQLIRNRSVMSLAAANREVYGFLIEEILASARDSRNGGQRIGQAVDALQCHTTNPRLTHDLLLPRLLSGAIELTRVGISATQEIA
jgi:type I restriction enzyme, R subunit